MDDGTWTCPLLTNNHNQSYRLLMDNLNKRIVHILTLNTSRIFAKFCLNFEKFSNWMSEMKMSSLYKSTFNIYSHPFQKLFNFKKFSHEQILNLSTKLQLNARCVWKLFAMFANGLRRKFKYEIFNSQDKLQNNTMKDSIWMHIWWCLSGAIFIYIINLY
jgi:hypothetical protein